MRNMPPFKRTNVSLCSASGNSVLLDGGHAKVDQLYLQIAFIVGHQQNVPWGHCVCWLLDKKTATNKTQWVIHHLHSFAFIGDIRGTRGRDHSAQFPSRASTSLHRKASASAIGNALILSHFLPKTRLTRTWQSIFGNAVYCQFR